MQTQRLIREVLQPPPDVEVSRHRAKVEEIVRLIRADIQGFVQQVVLYEATQREQGRPFSSGFAYTLFEEARISAENYPDAVGTLLYCDDRPIREEARRLFKRGLERKCIEGQPDLSHIRDQVLGKFPRNSEIAEPLRRAIFEQVPSAGFLLFHTEAERDEFIPYRRKERAISNALYEKKWLGGIPGEKVNAETAAALRELGESKYWWSRMFAAEIMVQNKEFRDAELIKRLLEDENKLVRQSVASIEKPDPLRFAKVDK